MVETGARSAPQPAYAVPTPQFHAAEPAHPREPMAMPEARSLEIRAPEVRAPEPVAVPPEPAFESSVPALRPTPFMHVQRTERPPIDPDLPADTPLEPGSAGRGRSPAERIAASEAASAPSA